MLRYRWAVPQLLPNLLQGVAANAQSAGGSAAVARGAVATPGNISVLDFGMVT